MGADTKIEWTHHTFNAWVGCTKVSPGCDSCYAEGWAKRAGRDVWGPGKPRQKTSPNNWRQPLKWDKEAQEAGEKRFVFCNSLADVFDNEVPNEWRQDLWRLISYTPNLVWLLLTKRIGNVEKMLSEIGDGFGSSEPQWPRNAWLGISVVNQTEADRDIPKLLFAKQALNIPKVFLSIEPMLGPIDLTEVPLPNQVLKKSNALSPHRRHSIDWVICGGESGKAARPMHPSWVSLLRAQCAGNDVPFFFKQWGEWIAQSQIRGMPQWIADLPNSYPIDINTAFARAGKKVAGRLLDGQEHNGRPEP